MNKRLWSTLVIGGMLVLSACNANNDKNMNDKPAAEMNEDMQSDAPMNDDKMMNDDKAMNDNKMMDDGK